MMDFSLTANGRKNIQSYLLSKGYKASFENYDTDYRDTEHIILVLQDVKTHKIVRVNFERSFFADKFRKFLKNNDLD